MPISFYEARQQILDTVPLLDIETVPLIKAAGRAVAEDITANQPLPAFDNSAMDGYAVRTEDCSKGTVLPVIGSLPAGEVSAGTAQPGVAVKIMTGAPVPQGADAVIPLENCKTEHNQITIMQTVKKGDHIRWTGEDIRPGDLIIPAGTPLRPAEISLLASLRQATIPVRRQVRVAVLATGDELQEIDELPFKGGVVNGNSWALAAAIQEIGAVPLIIGIARDNLPDLRQKVTAGLKADVLITSAGVSAGDHDLVRKVLEEFKVKEIFWKLKIKPGHPTAFGIREQTPVFSLPGNPVSTLLTFEEFVRPALLKMMGHHNILKPLYRATLTEPIKKKKGRLQILRVAVTLDPNGEMLVSSAGDQNTGIQRTLVASQGIALLEAERDFFAAGEKINIHLLGPSTAIGY
ncbi:gephyrin-like molybdotransferase Glp [uncultured Desulfuromusa sp.]|uniref:molybdopterin molybdotransferase MoeA n=1 Tax=uncultured Desulfuromusa sp. TaxID=219183 RepID=UPI002AA6ACD8|nr:gephyrin-like molybdotransferase Glp [uncultured Desulfuromusa sp.]